jgi:hypothetical protein
MPNINRDQTVYIPTGNPDTWSADTLQRPGELGKAYDYNDRTYQRVKLDSGATAANTVGAVAANQLAFWKDRANYLVTNDKRQAEGGSLGTNAFANSVAGIFRSAVTAGRYCDILVRGRNIAVSDTNDVAVGETLIADITANTAKAAGEGVGTAPTYNPIGRCRTASATNVCYADIDLTNIP